MQYVLAGSFHGEADFAYAVLRLTHTRGCADFRTEAEQVLWHEDVLVNTEQHNWTDLCGDVEDNAPADLNPLNYLVAWCDGANGTGTARIDTLNLLVTLKVHRDIDSALILTQTDLSAKILRYADRKCCNDLDHIESLLT